MAKKIITIFFILFFVFTFSCSKKKQQTDKHEINKMEAAEAIKVGPNNKICPVSGHPVNKEVFTEYKGKKYYFCCASCIEPFLKNPEKYIK